MISVGVRMMMAVPVVVAGAMSVTGRRAGADSLDMMVMTLLC